MSRQALLRSTLNSTFYSIHGKEKRNQCGLWRIGENWLVHRNDSNEGNDSNVVGNDLNVVGNYSNVMEMIQML